MHAPFRIPGFPKHQMTLVAQDLQQSFNSAYSAYQDFCKMPDTLRYRLEYSNESHI